MTLTGENPSTEKETSPSATSSTTNLTWYGLGSKMDLRGERLATRLADGSDWLRGPERLATRLTEGSEWLRGP